MKCYPLGIAGLLAIACDCIRRGDLDGAHAALAHARALAREGDDRRGDGARRGSTAVEAR